MTAAVVENLALLAEAPSGVTQLRELILNLAANGRLCSEDTYLRATQLRELVVSSGAGWSPSCDSRPRRGDEWGVLKVSAVSWGRFQPKENKALPSTLTPRPELEVQAGDFLVSRANTAELVARSVVVEDTPPKLMLSDKIVRLRLSEACDPRFVQIANSAPEARRYYARVAGGTSSSMKNVSREQILALPILLPPLAEQRRIVAKVDELMALCGRLEARQLDTEAARARLVQVLLDSLAQARDVDEFEACWLRLAGQFSETFQTAVSLDALRRCLYELAISGRLVEQCPEDEPASVALHNIREARRRAGLPDTRARRANAEVVETVGVLPAGWARTEFADVAIEVATGPFGSLIHQSDYREGGVPLINPSHMVDGRIVHDPRVALPPEKANELSSYRLQAGDMVMARRGEVGRVALVSTSEHGWLCGTGSFRLRFTDDVHPEFVRVLFQAPSVRRYLAGAAVGTTMVNLNHGVLAKLPVALPPLAEQRRIVAKVTELLALCDWLKARIAAARAKHVQLADALVEAAVA